MKKLNLLIALIIITFTPACSQKHESDAWEIRLNKIQPPEQVMDTMGIKPGMIIGEVGAGRGRYAVHLAGRVGNKGKIYAEDIDKESLDYLDYRCNRDKISNIETILGELTDPLFPKNSLDMVYMINTYHHLEKKVELLKNIIPALKSNGILVIIENDPKKSSASSHESTSKEILLKQAGESGFESFKIATFLVRDNIYFFRLHHDNSN